MEFSAVSNFFEMVIVSGVTEYLSERGFDAVAYNEQWSAVERGLQEWESFLSATEDAGQNSQNYQENVVKGMDVLLEKIKSIPRLVRI